MPKRILPLTPLQIDKAKPKDKKLTDGGGLYILITPSGGKLWRMDYRFDGMRKTLSFGSYPTITLAEARQRREDAKKLLANGVDPGAVKKAQKEAEAEQATTFEVVAREWYAKNTQWSDSHATTVKTRLERDVYPIIGSTPIAELDPQRVLSVLRNVEVRGAIHTAYRIKIIIGQVCRYAVVTGRATSDPAAFLKPKEVLQQAEVKHHAAITDPKQLPALLRAIDDYQGTFTVKCALQLAPMFFLRPGELQKMEWSEVDFENEQINIPAQRMKMKHPHIVPLSKQATAILKALHQVTGTGKYLFPGRTSSRPMSNNTINAALRYLGFDKETMTGHGFRATARTILDEVLQVRPDFVEHQLSHAVRDANGRAYNRTSHLAERRKMMQRWSDYLDGLKHGAKVIPFKRAQG